MSPIQYTIRNVPPAVDQAIRKQAREKGRSFNQTVVELLTLQTLGTATPEPDDRFDWLFGQHSLGTGFDQAVAELSQVDEALWPV